MIPGQLHIYTGDGKGKTTAALGLVLRAFGAGLRVFVAQFVKDMRYSEVDALERLSPDIVVRQYGRGCIIDREPSVEDEASARRGLEEVRVALIEGQYELVVLDEANIALYFGLFEVEELLSVLEARHPKCEVVVTGRYAPRQLIEKADLVTEMRPLKHYFERGVMARVGIER